MNKIEKQQIEKKEENVDYNALYKPEKDIKVIKKDGSKEIFNVQKVIIAVGKSAYRALTKFTEEDKKHICEYVIDKVNSMDTEEIPIAVMHNIVENVLEQINPTVAKSYRDYRNYKQDFVRMMDDVYKKSQSIMYVGDKENSNTDSALVSTKRSLIFNQFNKELYQKFFMTTEEIQACRDGYIYVHDMSARRDTMNCDLFDVESVLTGGFEMGNIWYNEPKSLDVAFDVIGDIVLSAASQQYGGFTVPEVDKILAPYAQKSYDMYVEKYVNKCHMNLEEAKELAMEDIQRDFEQGYQGWEYKFNTVSSSRGDYPFITMTFGLGTGIFEKTCSKTILKVRREGQGKKDKKVPVLFPKLVYLYTKDLNDEGCVNEDVFDEAVLTSSKTMYPDWLSLDGNTTVAKMYHQYGKVISPMGCRAFLSPWYKKGGMQSADENDTPVFVGRFNIGAVSLHLPMILAKARQENKDFHEVLDYYLNLIRQLHIRTYAYLGEMKASTNPLAYCEGGFYNPETNAPAHLKPHDKIKPLLKAATASFGITALNELQMLYNGKSLVEDGNFALETLEYINKKVKEFKEEDGNLYAIYGTPAENLCFIGDTEIQTYPNNKKIKDIKEGDLVYSFNEKEHKVELKKVVAAKMTQKNTVVVKVTFDNGQSEICTPNHPFAVRKMTTNKLEQFTGREQIEYVAAKDLKKGDRVKSNYVYKNSAGRLECSIYHDGSHQLIQNINAEYAYGTKPNGYVTHHKDEDKLNNLFENLQYLPDATHRSHHYKNNIAKYCYTSESQSGANNTFYNKHHSDTAKLKNRIAHLGRSIIRIDINNNIIERFDCLNDVQKHGYTRHLAKLACDGIRKVVQGSHYYKNSYWYYSDTYPELAETNHKVVSVEVLSTLHDVYNIEVKDNHNYFVGGNNGILVHNCGLQVKQFRAKYGIIEGVSDREYVSNSFHCHVTEDITPIQKQDLESRFWNLSEGGRIQYVKYPVDYNIPAIKTLVRRAMDMGFYEGVNLSLAYCNDCGHQELSMDVCPVCGSKNLTKIDRMNGYLSYSRVHGDTRLNDAKMAEIADRKSM